jgi:hypothetical protein
MSLPAKRSPWIFFLPPLILRLCAFCWGGATAQAPAKPLVAKVTPTISGTLTEAMSTSFQLAPWTDDTFTAHPDAVAQLTNLNPHHINVQVIDKSIPETAPGVWDFSVLDHQLQPILSAADHSPLIQLAQAPAYLYRTKTHFVTPAFIAGFTDYAVKIVQHYNAPGSPHPIEYWGILNEPNYFNISPSEYVAIYNAVVPAMRAVDPTIKIAALELGGEAKDERTYLPIFIKGVTAPVDIVAVHFYATCDQRDTDQTVFDSVPKFVDQLHFIRRAMRANLQLRNIPIWILENNVNADFIDESGNSTCDSTHKFIADARGTGPFFAAWRSDEFARYGRAGVQALYHWVFSGDQQDGELNTADHPSHLQLSYWVDYWLGKEFPPDSPAQLLSISNPDTKNIELLAVRRPQGKVTLLFSNHAVTNPSDNNGNGTTSTITVDLSEMGAFKSASQLTFDASTDPINGPQEQPVTFQTKMQLTLKGYGLILLTLQK